MYYSSLNDYYKKTFGCKVYKLALQSGAYCPNRDGTVGNRGCIFCSATGSGDFAEPQCESIALQIERAKNRVAEKNKNGKYIAYFQNYSATYLPFKNLQKLLKESMDVEDVVAVSLATRPDCLDDEVLNLLREFNKIKPIFVELGLQTIHKKSADYIRRGYDLPIFDESVKRLKSSGINVVVHIILGLPDEDKQMMIETARYVGRSGADGVKFHLLHILKNTDLYKEYLEGKVEPLSLETYTEILADCIKNIPKETVIHRLTGDGDKKLLAAPVWSADKKRVLNFIKNYFEKTNLMQGECL